mgnify:CR=1 FL=1|jgi:hypothetical protein
MQDLVMKYAKYLLEGLAIAVAAYVIPQKKTNVKDVAKIALVGAITFAILDLFAPAVSGGARTGAGFGIGAQHVGFLEGMENKEDEGFSASLSSRDEEGFSASLSSRDEEGFSASLSSRQEENFQNEDEDEDEDFEVEGFKL